MFSRSPAEDDPQKLHCAMNTRSLTKRECFAVLYRTVLYYTSRAIRYPVLRQRHTVKRVVHCMLSNYKQPVSILSIIKFMSRCWIDLARADLFIVL